MCLDVCVVSKNVDPDRDTCGIDVSAISEQKMKALHLTGANGPATDNVYPYICGAAFLDAETIGQSRRAPPGFFITTSHSPRSFPRRSSVASRIVSPFTITGS